MQTEAKENNNKQKLKKKLYKVQQQVCKQGKLRRHKQEEHKGNENGCDACLMKIPRQGNLVSHMAWDMRGNKSFLKLYVS